MVKVRNFLKLLIGWPFSILSILFILKLLSSKSSEITPFINKINYYYLLLSIVVFLIYYFIRGILWKKILEYQGKKLNYVENAYLFELSELRRYIPGNIWSYIGRAVLFEKTGVAKELTAKSLLIEVQLIVIGSLLASVFSFAWLVTSSGKLKLELISLLPICFGLATAFFLLTGIYYKRKFSKEKSLIKLILLPGFSNFQKIKLIILSTIVFFVFGIAYSFSFLAVLPGQIQLFLPLTSFFVFALLIGYLSFITPLGIGVREGIIAFGLLRVTSLTISSFTAILGRILFTLSELIYLLIISIIYRLRR